jgi:hypothetical protein
VTDSPATRWTFAHPFAVPGTGRRRWRYENWLRRPRNASIKRALLGVFDSLRGIDVPPSSYDDMPRSCERSWKRHRRTRWHETAP